MYIRWDNSSLSVCTYKYNGIIIQCLPVFISSIAPFIPFGSFSSVLYSVPGNNTFVSQFQCTRASMYIMISHLAKMQARLPRIEKLRHQRRPNQSRKNQK